MRVWSNALVLPLAILLAETLIFYGSVLFSKRFGIPFDIEGYHQPLAAFIAESLRGGKLPLWDPYTYCGFPLYANLQAQLFYPPAWPVFLIGALNRRNLFRALEFELALHVFLAGALTYWMLRRMNLSRGAALLGGTIFELGGFFASQTQHLGAICGSAWLALAWGAALELRDGFSRRGFVLLTTGFAMAILAGFPSTAAIVIGSTALLAIIMTLARRAQAWLLATVAAASISSLLISGVALLPAYELSKLSQAALRGDWTTSAGGLRLEALVSMALPNHYDIFDLDKFATHHIPANPEFLYLYCGVAGLLLGLGGIARSKHADRRVFTLLTLICGLWMLGDATPAGRILFPLLPKFIRGGLYNDFAMAAFLLGFTTLAALGAERLLAPRGRVVMGAVIALTAIDLIHTSANTYMNRLPGPSNTYAQIGGSRSSVERLRAIVNETFPPGRIDETAASSKWANSAPLFRIPSANGDDPLALTRLLKLRLLFASGDYWTRYYEVSSPDSAVLDLLNIRYLVTRNGRAIDSPKFILREELERDSVWENVRVAPRFFLVNRVERVRDLDDALSRLRSAEFDPTRTAIAEDAPPMEMSGERATSSVRTLSYSDAELELDIDTPNDAYLVTSESWYPGWRAWIDGRERSLTLTNVAFRGLAVPAGHHRIRMRFAPRILWYGAAVSLASLAGLGVILGRNRN